MKRLSRVGERRRRHSDLQRAEHVIKMLHPREAILFFRQGEMQRDAQIHLLRGLQRLTFVAADHVAAQQQLQPRIGELLVVRGVDKRSRFVKLFFCIAFENSYNFV